MKLKESEDEEELEEESEESEEADEPETEEAPAADTDNLGRRARHLSRWEPGGVRRQSGRHTPPVPPPSGSTQQR